MKKRKLARRIVFVGVALTVVYVGGIMALYKLITEERNSHYGMG